jgi:hypothetical protein
VARPLRGDHADVDAGRRLDVAEPDVEPVPEEERVAVGDVGRDGLGVEMALDVVRDEDHDHVRFLDGLRRRHDAQALRLGLRPALAVLGEPDPDVDARVAQAERVGVALTAVAENGHIAALDDGQIGVGVVQHLGHGNVSFKRKVIRVDPIGHPGDRRGGSLPAHPCWCTHPPTHPFAGDHAIRVDLSPMFTRSTRIA